MKRIIYSDIVPDMSSSWDRDVGVATNVRAVKNSLIGIIMTKKGTRPFDPYFGCDINNQLFENFDYDSRANVQESIIEAIKTYEPRIAKIGVDVTSNPDDNTLIVTIGFSIIEDPDTIESLKLQLSP